MTDRIARLNASLGGRYTVERELGEGGMAVVYLAQQHEPVRRTVALKVLSQGAHSAEMLERFAVERQALARMDHPSIATVFDAGVTADGEPYFAMERVEGTRITAFCDERRLDVRARILLYIDVLNAVQHAHQKGVIHRDLKPSNVLVREVDGVPRPRIIDFGIAKATGADEFDGTELTRADQVIGTPAYMSPEQISGGGDIDTRSDVYALGTMLYELLAGALPFDEGRYRGWAAVASLLEDEPPTMSRRLTSLPGSAVAVAEHRSTTPAALRAELAGDLGWIVTRAMEKDPERRYETAHAFALDLQRHLDHEVVLARAAGRSYRMRKFIRRNRTQVAVASLGVVGLGAFAVTSTVQAARIAEARDEAEARRDQAEGLIDFMLSDLREKLEPIGRLEVLDDVGDRALQYFASVPEELHTDEELASRSQALHQLGQVRLSQGRIVDAEPLFRESLRLARALSARDPADNERLFDLGQSQFWVGALAFRRGVLSDARREWERYRDISLELWSRDSTNLTYLLEVGYAHTNLGAVLSSEGDGEGSVREYRAGLEIKKRVAEVEPENPARRYDLAQGHHNLGRGLVEVGDLDDAEDQFRADIAIREELLEADPDNTRYRLRLLVSRNWLARIRYARGDLPEALRLRRAAADEAANLSRRDPTNATWRAEWALAQAELGKVLAESGESDGPDVAARGVSALADLVAGDPENADRRLELARALRSSAESLLTVGRVADARREAERAVSAAEEALDRDRVNRAASLELGRASIALGDALLGMDDGGEATAAWTRAREVLAPLAEGTRDWQVLSAAAAALERLGADGEARPLLDALRAQEVATSGAPGR